MSTQPLPLGQFAAKVRAKYPGAYDHLGDQDLADKVTAKYPQYKDSILPSAGASETIANIIPENEAATRTRFAANPTTSAAQNQEKRLNDYNEGGQLLSAASAPSAFGVGRALLANPAKTIESVATGLGGAAAGSFTGREIGGMFGPTGRKVGGFLGGLVGGGIGGIRGWRGTPEIEAPAITETETPNPFSEEAIASRKANAPESASRFKGEMDARRAIAKANHEAAIPTVPATAIETPPVRTTPFAQPEPTQRFAGPTTEPAKPSPFKTRPAVENIVNSAFKVEPPPKAPFGQPLRATMAPAESAPVTRPIGGRTPEEQFQHSFGPEEEHVKGQAKWDTGNEHGNFPKPPSEKLPEQNPFKQSYESEEARKAAHGGEYEKWKSLGRVDLRQALIDAGIDMKDKIVSDAKMLGPGAMSRREAIQALTERGVKPPSVQPSTAPR